MTAENGNKENPPTSGYVFVSGTATDSKSGPEYAAKVPATLAPFGGKFLFRCMVSSAVYNEVANFQNAVCIEFPSIQDALDWESSADYDALKSIRDETANFNAFVIMEGLPAAAASEEKKGYLIATAKVKDAELFKAEYSSKVGATVEAYDGRFLLKGTAKAAAFNKQDEFDAFDLVAIVQFPSAGRAMEWQSSDAYRALVPARNEASKALSFLVFEG